MYLVKYGDQTPCTAVSTIRGAKDSQDQDRLLNRGLKLIEVRRTQDRRQRRDVAILDPPECAKTASLKALKEEKEESTETQNYDVVNFTEGGTQFSGSDKYRLTVTTAQT